MPFSSNLTDKEMTLLKDVEFLTAKKKIIENLMSGFEEIAAGLKEIYDPFVTQLPAWSPSVKSKVSRGENYKDLPYVVLDCPAMFDRENLFTFRTLCWWGNHLSCHFIIAGAFLDYYLPALKRGLSTWQETNGLFCVAQDPWQHDLLTSEYEESGKYDVHTYQEKILTRPFFKISWGYPLEDWDQLSGNCQQNLAAVLKTLQLS